MKLLIIGLFLSSAIFVQANGFVSNPQTSENSENSLNQPKVNEIDSGSSFLNTNQTRSSLVVPMALFPGYLKSNSQSGWSGGTDDDSDDQMFHGRPLAFPENEVLYLMSHAVREEILSKIYNWLIPPEESEPVDEGGGEKNNNAGTGQTQTSDETQQTSRWSGCFSFLFSCFGRRGRGDEDDERNPQHLEEVPLLECQASAITCSESVPVNPPGQEEPVELAEVPIDHSVDTPAQYMLIMNNVYLSNDPHENARVAESLSPSGSQEVVYIRWTNECFVAALLDNKAENLNCHICMSLLTQPRRINCDSEHVYCHKCITKHIGIGSHSGETANCPECQTHFDPDRLEIPRQIERQLSDLSVTCPWCQASTTVSEAADHLRLCERQPVICTVCSEAFDPELLGSHLQGHDISTGERTPEEIKQLAEQLAMVLKNAIFPQSRQQAEQRIRFSDGVVVEPLDESPLFFRRVGADPADTEFYIRLDLTHFEELQPGDSYEEDTYAHLIDKAFCLQNKHKISIKISIKYPARRKACTEVIFSAYTDSSPSTPGRWSMALLDINGSEISNRIGDTQWFSGASSCEEGEHLCIYRQRLIWEDYFDRYGTFWKQDKEKRVVYIRMWYVSMGQMSQ